jgi:TP901 family phage tail tape measure protein
MAKKFSIEAIFKARDFLSKPIGKIKGQLGGLGKAGAGALKGLDVAVNRSLRGLQSMSTALGIAGVVSAATIASQFQTTMTEGLELEKVLARAGAALETPVLVGTKGFAQLETAARAVGKTTEFAAQQGAEGLLSLVTAGYNAEQSIGALPKVIDFASASTLDLAQSSDIASNTLGTFSLRSVDAAKNTANMGRVMDALSRAAADSTTNVAELFEGISMGGSFASTSGASLETFIALQGVLASKSIKGAEAGTAIRNSYVHLVKQTKEAKDAMARLGVRVAKTKDGKVDLIATIGRFEQATKKLTASQKAEAIQTIFGSYTSGAFLALMGAGAGTISKFERNLRRAKGTTQEMAEAMRKTDAARLARVFNVLKDVRLSVFKAIAPAVLDIATAVQKWVVANEDLIATKAGEWAATLRDNLPEIAIWIERIAKAVTALLVVSAVVKAITLLSTIIGGLATAFAWAEFTALLLGTTIGAIAWPILLIGAAIAGLVALAYAYWPELTAFFSGLYDWAVDKVGKMWAWIQGAFESVRGFFVAWAEFLVGLLRLVFAPGIEAVKLYVEVAGAWLSFLVDLIKRIWEPLGEWFSLFWSGIVETQKGYFDIVASVWSGLVEVFSGVWQAIADGFARIVAPIVDTATGIINTIRAVGRMTLGTSEGDGAAPTAPAGAPTPQVISPQERAAKATTEATGASSTVDGTITVKAEKGTAAKVKAQPKKVGIRVEPSGAFG